MSRRFRTVSLAVLAASALALTSPLPSAFGVLGSQPAFAQGHGGGSSNGGGGGGGGGGGSNSGGGGSSASSNAHSSNGNSGTAHGHSGASTQSASLGQQSSKGTPQAVIRQYVLATGLKQGDVARTLKSWNSLNRNPRAFAAALNNPNSLAALQVAYIRDNMAAQQKLNDFLTLTQGDTTPPTAQQYADASAYLSAEQMLADAGTDAATVLADPTSDPALIDAANTVTNYIGPDAQTVVDQYNAWTDYQTAEATATDAFKATSVSYRNADQATLDALRKLVDDIVTTEGLDTMVSSL